MCAYVVGFAKASHIYILYQGLNLINVLRSALFAHALATCVRVNSMTNQYRVVYRNFL